MKYLIALIGVALPAYLIRFSILGIPTTALEILIYIVFIIGLINIKKAAKIPRTYLWPIILLLIAALISVFVSPDKRVALGEFKAFFIDPILVFWLVVSYIKINDIFWLVGGLAGSSLIVSGHAIYQKIIGNVTIDGRVVGLFGYSPNYLALFLAPIIIVSSIWYLVSGWQKKNYWMLGFGILLSVVNIIALYLSGSRGGLLALGGGLVFYFLMRFWPIIKTKLWLKIGLGLIIAASIIGAGWVFRPDFTLRGDVPSRVISSNNVRYMIWQASVELGTKHPILGVGLGNFQNAFTDLTIKRINFDNYIIPWALSPHNLFLMFWLSTGVLGLIAVIWIIVKAFWQGLRNLNTLNIILLSGLGVIILQGLIDTPYFKNDLSIIFWLAIAGIIIANNHETNS